MRSLHRVASTVLGATLLAVAASCADLDVTNPNNPDVERVLSNPDNVLNVAGGVLSTWFDANQSVEIAGPLNTMADAYTASWNNYYMRIYSSQPRTHWRNDPSSAERTTIEWLWYEEYSGLSSANDALRVIRDSLLDWTGRETELKMAETMATLGQALTLGDIALNYDRGFVVFEDTPIEGLEFVDRTAVRDAALQKFDEAIALANANEFDTPGEWTGGLSYSNEQIAQIANTAAARVLAYFARSAAENAQTDWARVVTYAQNGLSKPGEEFDFEFEGNANCPDLDGTRSRCDELKLWGQDPTSMRVDTRIAHMLDPVTQQMQCTTLECNPTRPNSPDRRLGDGSFGPEGWAEDFGGFSATSDAGTDFAWVADNYFPEDRGNYHQSNIVHVRWVTYGFNDPNGGNGGEGAVPIMTWHENDLLWAEGLIRSGGSLALAAEKINKTRVDRGELSAATAGEGIGAVNPAPGAVGTGLLGKLQYEQDIELLGLASVPYYNRRRIDGLQPGTPRILPVPAQELGVLGLPLYTFGGSFPDGGDTGPGSVALQLTGRTTSLLTAGRSPKARRPFGIARTY